MKTKNNVQKATTKLVTFGLMMVFGISVCAHGIKKPVSETNTSQELTTAKFGFGGESSFTSDTEVFASFLELEAEPALEVEDWMTNENSFDVFSSYHQLDQEVALEVETWMKDETTFFPSHSEFKTSPDPEAELEAWMTSDEVWNP